MPIITLTSDFGIQSHALASVKGKILCQLSDAQIIDISHTQEGFNLQQTAYHFKQAFIHFPEGSFHFVFNDLYADKNHKLLYAYENKQHIFCADNGFLTMLFDDKPMQMYCLQDKIQPYTFLTVADHFIASVRSILLYNEFPIVSIDVSKIIIRHPSKPFYTNDMLEAQVLYIDPYGNVILNVQRKQLEEIAAGRKFKILFMRDEEINAISTHYNDVPEGEKLCLFNTANYLEIAVNKGNAARLFGFQEMTDRSLFYNSVKLFFT